MGAKELLENQKIECLQFEYGGTYPDAHTFLYDVMRNLTSMGYVIFRIEPYGLVHVSQWSYSLEDYGYTNFFATLPSNVPGYHPMQF